MRPLILIADDDAKHRKLLTDVLEAEGYATLLAEDGESAIALARSARPNLILMDVQMPVLDGLAAVKVLKTDPDTQSIPAIAITALAMRDDRERMLAAGFKGYLSKPIRIKELRAEVKRYLEGTSRQEEGATKSAERHAGDTP